MIITNYEELKPYLEGKVIPNIEIENQCRKPYGCKDLKEYMDITVYSDNLNYTTKDIRKILKEFRNDINVNETSKRIVDIILDNVALLSKVKLINDRSYFSISALLGYRSIDVDISISFLTIESIIENKIKRSESSYKYPYLQLLLEEKLDLIMNYTDNFYIYLNRSFT